MHDVVNKYRVQTLVVTSYYACILTSSCAQPLDTSRDERSCTNNMPLQKIVVVHDICTRVVQ